MTEETTNGARPPDAEQWPKSGPIKRKHQIENMLSSGKSFGLDDLTRVCGGPGKAAYFSTSRDIRDMVKSGLVAELPHPEDLRQKLFRWSWYEEQEPSPEMPKLADWMQADPDVHIVKDNPIGFRTRWAYQWLRVRTAGAYEEMPSRPMGDISDDELKMWLEDVCLHSGDLGMYMNAAPGKKRGGTVTGDSLLARLNTFGDFGSGMRNAIGRWLGQNRERYPLMLWCPECFIQSTTGYRLHPHVQKKLMIISAIPAMIPKGCWAPPGEVVREAIAKASSVWVQKTFIGS